MGCSVTHRARGTRPPCVMVKIFQSGWEGEEVGMKCSAILLDVTQPQWVGLVAFHCSWAHLPCLESGLRSSGEQRVLDLTTVEVGCIATALLQVSSACGLGAVLAGCGSFRDGATPQAGPETWVRSRTELQVTKSNTQRASQRGGLKGETVSGAQSRCRQHVGGLAPTRGCGHRPLGKACSGGVLVTFLSLRYSTPQPQLMFSVHGPLAPG